MKFTKRSVLSRIAEICDPIGICASVVLMGKLFFQSITRLNFEWDNEIMNNELLKLWDIRNDEIAMRDDVVIPLSILPTGKIDEKEL